MLDFIRHHDRPWRCDWQCGLTMCLSHCGWHKQVHGLSDCAGQFFTSIGITIGLTGCGSQLSFAISIVVYIRVHMGWAIALARCVLSIDLLACAFTGLVDCSGQLPQRVSRPKLDLYSQACFWPSASVAGNWVALCALTIVVAIYAYMASEIALATLLI